jgi:DNA-binding NtrC family response regulator
MSRYSLLYVDDDPIDETVKERVEPAGFTVTTCANAQDLGRLLDAPDFEYDVALVDYKLDQGFSPHFKDGIEVTKALLHRNPEMGVVAISGWLGPHLGGSSVTVADWLYAGACWFCEKLELENPRDFERTLQILKTRADRVADWRALRQRAGAVDLRSYKGLTEAVKIADRIARLPLPVLLLGETGVGKELFARRIHEAINPDAPFVVGNCANLKGEMAELTLHGQERHQNDSRARGFPKAGWFEKANGGTLFLDEIGDLDLQLQAGLLRVLQEKKLRRVLGDDEVEVDFRLIAATNHDLTREAEQGLFRKDLYFRIAVIPIVIPSLEQRRVDVRPLLEHFRLKYTSMFGISVEFSEEVITYLVERDYPGNVRELENLVQRIVALSERKHPTLSDVERLDYLRLTPDEAAKNLPPIRDRHHYIEVFAEVVRRLLDDPSASVQLKSKAALVRRAKDLVTQAYALSDSLNVPGTLSHILERWLKPHDEDLYERIQQWTQETGPDGRRAAPGSPED